MRSAPPSTAASTLARLPQHTSRSRFMDAKISKKLEPAKEKGKKKTGSSRVRPS